MAGSCCYSVILPFAAMLALGCIYVGSNTFFKAASDNGLSYYVFVVYSHGLAALLLVFTPFIFGSAIYLILLFRGVSYSSPTLAAATTNLVPAFAFILAIIFRMETVKLRSSRCWARIIGTIVSISGALVVTLYKGPVIVLTKCLSTCSNNPLGTTESKWVRGGLLLTAAYMLLPFALVLQAQILEEYPSELVFVFFNNLFITLVSGVIGLVLEPNLDAWRLSPDVALAAILYTGTVGAVLSSAGYAWIIHLKGPLYVAMFSPMNIAIAVGMGFIFLGDTLHIGSVVGAIVMCMGFYAVLWGKADNEKGENCKGSLEAPSSHKTPFLQGSNIEDV
ncbi:hypothetical protein RJ641_022747 [Dillenia turbinata]|uniref:WAT1-related protein n=1 Tax=Dillenia turbinata TaxID=194707 RepID=A0AAN8UJX5_9MAGN